MWDKDQSDKHTPIFKVNNLQQRATNSADKMGGLYTPELEKAVEMAFRLDYDRIDFEANIFV